MTHRPTGQFGNYVSQEDDDLGSVSSKGNTTHSEGDEDTHSLGDAGNVPIQIEENDDDPEKDPGSGVAFQIGPEPPTYEEASQAHVQQAEKTRLQYLSGLLAMDDDEESEDEDIVIEEPVGLEGSPSELISEFVKMSEEGKMETIDGILTRLKTNSLVGDPRHEAIASALGITPNRDVLRKLGMIIAPLAMNHHAIPGYDIATSSFLKSAKANIEDMAVMLASIQRDVIAQSGSVQSKSLFETTLLKLETEMEIMCRQAEITGRVNVADMSSCPLNPMDLNMLVQNEFANSVHPVFSDRVRSLSDDVLGILKENSSFDNIAYIPGVSLASSRGLDAAIAALNRSTIPAALLNGPHVLALVAISSVNIGPNNLVSEMTSRLNQLNDQLEEAIRKAHPSVSQDQFSISGSKEDVLISDAAKLSTKGAQLLDLLASVSEPTTIASTLTAALSVTPDEGTERASIIQQLLKDHGSDPIVRGRVTAVTPKLEALTKEFTGMNLGNSVFAYIMSMMITGTMYRPHALELAFEMTNSVLAAMSSIKLNDTAEFLRRPIENPKVCVSIGPADSGADITIGPKAGCLIQVDNADAILPAASMVLNSLSDGMRFVSVGGNLGISVLTAAHNGSGNYTSIFDPSMCYGLTTGGDPDGVFLPLGSLLEKTMDLAGLGVHMKSFNAARQTRMAMSDAINTQLDRMELPLTCGIVEALLESDISVDVPECISEEYRKAYIEFQNGGKHQPAMENIRRFRKDYQAAISACIDDLESMLAGKVTEKVMEAVKGKVKKSLGMTDTTHPLGHVITDPFSDARKALDHIRGVTQGLMRNLRLGGKSAREEYFQISHGHVWMQENHRQQQERLKEFQFNGSPAIGGSTCLGQANLHGATCIGQLVLAQTPYCAVWGLKLHDNPYTRPKVEVPTTLVDVSMQGTLADIIAVIASKPPMCYLSANQAIPVSDAPATAHMTQLGTGLKALPSFMFSSLPLTEVPRPNVIRTDDCTEKIRVCTIIPPIVVPVSLAEGGLLSSVDYDSLDDPSNWTVTSIAKVMAGIIRHNHGSYGERPAGLGPQNSLRTWGAKLLKFPESPEIAIDPECQDSKVLLLIKKYNNEIGSIMSGGQLRPLLRSVLSVNNFPLPAENHRLTFKGIYSDLSSIRYDSASITADSIKPKISKQSTIIPLGSHCGSVELALAVVGSCISPVSESTHDPGFNHHPTMQRWKSIFSESLDDAQRSILFAPYGCQGLTSQLEEDLSELLDSKNSSKSVDTINQKELHRLLVRSWVVIHIPPTATGSFNTVVVTSVSGRDLSRVAKENGLTEVLELLQSMTSDITSHSARFRRMAQVILSRNKTMQTPGLKKSTKFEDLSGKDLKREEEKLSLLAKTRRESKKAMSQPLSKEEGELLARLAAGAEESDDDDEEDLTFSFRNIQRTQVTLQGEDDEFTGDSS